MQFPHKLNRIKWLVSLYIVITHCTFKSYGESYHSHTSYIIGKCKHTLDTLAMIDAARVIRSLRAAFFYPAGAQKLLYTRREINDEPEKKNKRKERGEAASMQREESD